METIDYETGKILFAEGDASRYCFKIISGLIEVRLWDVKRGEALAVVNAGPGEVLGCLNVIMNNPNPLSAVAIEPTRCERYGAEEVSDLLLKEPDQVRVFPQLF